MILTVDYIVKSEFDGGTNSMINNKKDLRKWLSVECRNYHRPWWGG